MDTSSSILFSQLSFDQIIEGVRRAVREEFIAVMTNDLQEKFLSPADTCKLFQPVISKVTLATWTKDGLLKDYRIGGRVYYKYSEVFEAAKHLKRYKNPTV